MLVLDGGALLWWRVDPHCGGQRGGLRAAALETVGGGKKCRLQRGGPGAAQGLGMTVVHAVRGYVANA